MWVLMRRFRNGPLNGRLSTDGLQSFSSGRIVWCIDMKPNGNGERHRVELGRHIVADAEICGGQPTFKGTRIMVWIVLEQLEDGLSWDEVVADWGGGKFPSAELPRPLPFRTWW